jgi:hypothetical protein
VGVYPDTVFDEDHFDFEKLTTGDGANIADWSNWGEDFGGLVGDIVVSAPDEYALHNAYPNPFNPMTTISFDLPEACKVSMIVYNIQGKEVVELVNEYKSAGSYEVTFNAKDLVSGVYFVRLEAGDFSQVQKIVLMK